MKKSVVNVPNNLETPFYVYGRYAIESQIIRLRQALPDQSRILYSVKANPFLDVVQVVREAGVDVEVCSMGELEVVLRAGYRGGEIVVGGPGKTLEFIGMAINNEVNTFSVESFYDWERIGMVAQKINKRVQVLLRANPASTSMAGLTMAGAATQFGFDEDELIGRIAGFRKHSNIDLRGLHIYFGTQIKNCEQLLISFQRAIECCDRLADAAGCDFEVLNLGGGFPWPFACPGAGDDLSSLREPMSDVVCSRRRNRLATVWFESGRYIVAASGKFVSSVLDIKKSRGRTFVVVDGGINCLGGMSGIGRIPRSAKPDWGDNAECTDLCDIVGPLCSPLDVLARGVMLPKLEIGDRVVFSNTGAYGLSASLVEFLSHKRPREMLTNG